MNGVCASSGSEEADERDDRRPLAHVIGLPQDEHANRERERHAERSHPRVERAPEPDPPLGALREPLDRQKLSPCVIHVVVRSARSSHARWTLWSREPRFLCDVRLDTKFPCPMGDELRCFVTLANLQKCGRRLRPILQR
jgi:hypothetical protein